MVTVLMVGGWLSPIAEAGISVTIDFILRNLHKSSLELGRASPELQPSPVLRRSSWDGHRAAEQELWSRLGLCCPWTLPPRCLSRIWDQDPTADDHHTG